jgi:glycosyltransferase involved in cell wall biosynthesis
VTGAPRVSVVVPTHERPARLRSLLERLRAQTLTPGAWEVVVVDDGSGPDTEAVLDAERARGELALVTRRHDRPRGPAASRNAGWRAARAPAVAFIDDDCEPAPGWLEAALRAHEALPEAIVQGRTLPNPRELHRDGIFSRSLRIERLGPNYESCNILYPRELLERLGGFEEGFGLAPGGEDTDLAWRALHTGRPAVFAPDALAHHAVEPLGPLGTLRVAARWSETMRVFARHPALRATLWRGVFWNVWHYLLLRTLLALWLPRPLRRLLLARYVLKLHRRARRDGAGPWAIPFLVVHDAVEVFAVARGGLRHRTLVL